MLVIYHPDTLEPLHIVHQAVPAFLAHQKAKTPHWIEHHEDMAHHEIEVVRIDGKPQLRRRAKMAIAAPATLALGQEARFSGIPEGVAIALNGEDCGIMDASGSLDFTPQTAGTYRFRFSGSGYVAQEVTLSCSSSSR